MMSFAHLTMQEILDEAYPGEMIFQPVCVFIFQLRYHSMSKLFKPCIVNTQQIVKMENNMLYL